jgi:hypothetical protein
MKHLILAATFVLAATAAQAQYLGTESNPNNHPVRAYTTAGPAGAGVYREEPLPTNPSSMQIDKGGTKGKAAVGARNARYLGNLRLRTSSLSQASKRLCVRGCRARPVTRAARHPLAHPRSRANVLAVVPKAGRAAMVGVETAAVAIGVDVAGRTHRDRAVPRDGPASEVAAATGGI